MTNDALDQILGQQFAFSLVLTALVQVLPPQTAQVAARSLSDDLKVNQGLDEEQQVEPAFAKVRDDIVGMYVSLLNAVGRS